MASRITKVSPFLTLLPTFTFKSITLPGIGATRPPACNSDPGKVNLGRIFSKASPQGPCTTRSSFFLVILEKNLVLFTSRSIPAVVHLSIFALVFSFISKEPSLFAL